MKKDTSEKIEKLRREYTDILKTQSHQSIEDALKVLNYYHGLCRKYEHSTVRIDLKADDEWVSNEDVDLNDKNQVIGEPIEIRDVTDIVRHNQIFCDISLTNEGNNIKNAKNEEEGIALIKDGIHNGRLRYINGEANINVNNLLIDDQIVKKIGEMAMELKPTDIKNARIHIAKNRDYIIPQNK